MTETKPLPKIAHDAFALLQQSFQRSANDLAVDVLELKPDGEGWTVNFAAGLFERPAPDAPPASDGAVPA